MPLSKSLLKKLHKQELERWRESWEKLVRSFESNLPYNAQEWLHEADSRLAAITEGKTQDELKALDKDTEAYLAELGTELQLNGDWWEWQQQLDRTEIPDLSKDPDLSLWPQQLPKPPGNPYPALQQMQRKRYEVTPQGWAEQHIAYYLAIAAAIWALR